MEAKEDSVRRLRQKVSAEKEKEERNIRDEMDKTQLELLQQLNKEKVTVKCLVPVIHTYRYVHVHVYI